MKYKIKNIVFDIGNVILNFNIAEVLKKFTNNENERKIILDNIINSPEWLGNALIDTGYILRENAIKIVEDRTNHEYDTLIEKFWNTYNDYAFIDERVLEIIKKLKIKGYNIYLLSNINPYTRDYINKSGLFDLVDGYVLSYEEHKIKPYESIYNVLIEKYKVNPQETIFIDDNQKNIDTGNKIGFISKKVEPDNYSSVLKNIKELNLL